MYKYENLVRMYPELFKTDPNSKEPFALFGFECDIGWYRIIQNLCRVLTSELDHQKFRLEAAERHLNDFAGYLKRRRELSDLISEEDCRDELLSSVNDAKSQLDTFKAKLPRFVQVKEKFGTLQIYMDYGDSKYTNLIMYSELMSCYTCEKCGNVGRTYRIGWNKTLCETHAIENYGKSAVDTHNEHYVQAIYDIEDL